MLRAASARCRGHFPPAGRRRPEAGPCPVRSSPRLRLPSALSLFVLRARKARNALSRMQTGSDSEGAGESRPPGRRAKKSPAVASRAWEFGRGCLKGPPHMLGLLFLRKCEKLNQCCIERNSWTSSAVSADARCTLPHDDTKTAPIIAYGGKNPCCSAQ